MISSPHPLPPLTAIRAFEAAARHENFSRAGEELGMTQAAVSYQIKALEGRVGRALFLREGRRVRLSPTGADLARQIGVAFDQMRDAFAAMDPRRDRVLHVSSLAAFSVQLLASRLGRFQIGHPDLAVQVSDSARMADFDRDGVDVAIRCGVAPWPGCRADFLMARRLTLVAAPSLLAAHPEVRTPADAARLPTNDRADREWQLWMAAAGATGAPDRSPVYVVDSQVQQVQMVKAGQYAAVVNAAMFAEELARGTIVAPFDLTITDERNYWLVYPENRAHLPKVRAFRKWLLAEMAALPG